MPPADRFSGGAPTERPSPRYTLKVSRASDAGRVRDQNEDAYCEERLPNGNSLYAVADGIGGNEGGEVASALAIATLVEVLKSPGPVAAKLRDGFHEANRRILSMQRALGQSVRGMGTTLTALVLSPTTGEGHIAHLGDSRLYRLRDGALALLTEDHSMAAELVRAGRLDPALASSHPQRHVLTRALGMGPEVVPDEALLDGKPDDLYLLATDGLTAALTDDDVAQAVVGVEAFDDVAPTLVARANAYGGPDNVTVVAVGLKAVNFAS